MGSPHWAVVEFVAEKAFTGIKLQQRSTLGSDAIQNKSVATQQIP
jgi:hypothetical protein